MPARVEFSPKASILLIVFFLAFAPTARCEVMHEIMIGNDTLHINSVLILRSQNPIDYWDLTISLPENIDFEKVNDELGRISD